MARPTLTARIGTLIAVVAPLIGLGAAIVHLWNYEFRWVYPILLVSGYVVTTLGITVGFHRLFTHRSFETGAGMKIILGAVGSMAVQGPILQWVATHRMHHRHSDRDGDPHSPTGQGSGRIARLRGFYHAHIGWFFAPAPVEMRGYVPDLLADPVVRRVSGLFGVWVILGLVIPMLVAAAFTGTWGGALLGLLWGGVLRVLLVQHITWSVNSVCHLWGSRPYRSHDHSRNNVVFGVLAFGEGWHNNHHAFPTSARHGLRWWQLDVSFLVIRCLEGLGLVRRVRVPTCDRMRDKLATGAGLENLDGG
jgi:stearoyl-CoA desaturase (Delta-9 desaturase)